MPNQSLVDLTERTATADTDLVHVNSGGSDYKQTKANFLKGDLYTTLSNSINITTSAESLPAPGTYFGYISSYSHQSATGMPENANFYIKIERIASTGYITIEAWNIDGAENSHYIKTKRNGTWESSWTRLPSRSEINSLNNSLTQRLIDISSSFVVNSSLNPTGYNAKAFYDPYTHSVRGSLFISTSATFDTSAVIYTISNSAYRPSTSVSIIGLITANNTRYPYNGNINSDGTVHQSASGICTGAWFTFEYKVA